MFPQANNLYIFYCHIGKEYRCLKNVIYQIERNEWFIFPALQHGLRPKFELFLTQEDAFS